MYHTHIFIKIEKIILHRNPNNISHIYILHSCEMLPGQQIFHRVFFFFFDNSVFYRSTLKSMWRQRSPWQHSV